MKAIYVITLPTLTGCTFSDAGCWVVEDLNSSHKGETWLIACPDNAKPTAERAE